MNKKTMRIMVPIAIIALLVMLIVCGRRKVLAEEEAARQAAIEAAYNDSIERIEYAKQAKIDAEKRRLAAIAQARRDSIRAVERAREDSIRAVERARKDSIARAEHAAFAKKYSNIGLIITEVKMTRGKDKDGDLTKGLSFRIFNPTKKTIKYVVASVAAINAVHDVMSYERTCRGIGPVDSYDYASWSFDDVFCDPNDVIDDLRVYFRVIYTNGTSKTVRVKDALYNGYFDDSWFE